MAALIFLVIIIAMGVAALLGWTADSRDPEYSLGKVLAPRADSGRDATEPGTLPSSGPRSSVDRAAAF
jgi:hypothetical protein